MSLPQRRTRQRMNVQPPMRVECRGHLRFVKTKFLCALAGKSTKAGIAHVCHEIIDPHHTPTKGAGGGDHETVPLCRIAHVLLDSPNWSEARLEAEYGVKLRQMAADLWKADTYNRTKFERDWKEEWGDMPLPYADQHTENGK